MSVKDRVIFIPRGPRGLTGAQGPTGNSSSESGRIDDLEIPTTQFIYWSDTANGGNDLNDGSNGSPVLTWERVVELIMMGRNIEVRVLGTTEMNYRFAPAGNIPSLSISTTPGANTSSNINIINAINVGTGGGFWPRGFCSFLVEDVNINLDVNQTSTQGFFNCREGRGSGTVRFKNVNFTQTSSNTSVLLSATTGARLQADFINSPIASISGKAFYSIASGTDPNSSFLYSANINSA